MSTGTEQPPATGRRLIDMIDDSFVLLVGFPHSDLPQRIIEASQHAGLAQPAVEQKTTLAEGKACLIHGPVSVFALGPDIDPKAAIDCLDEIHQNYSYLQHETILIGDYDPGILMSLVQDDRLFYFSPKPFADEEIARILLAGWVHSRDQLMLELAIHGRSKDPRVANDRKLFIGGETLLRTTDLETLEDPLLEALDDLIEIDAGRLWIYNSLGHALTVASTPDIEVSAIAGITSYVARTGEAVRLERAGDDPRFDLEADESTDDRFLAVPVLGPEDRSLGALTVRRHSTGVPFSQQDEWLTWRLAQYLAPILLLRAPQPFAVMQQRMSQATVGPDIFRREAIQANERDFSDAGRVLRNTPGWTRWTWGVLVTGFFAALIFASVGKMHEYANGPAIVRLGQRIDVPAHVAASVIAVEVEPGARVEEGEALVRLYGAPEVSEITNLENEFEQRLRQRLAVPGDAVIEASLINARTSLERARARLAERIVRAPSAGVVGDVRIRPGQHLEAGEFLLSVIADQEIRSVVGLVPGQFGPQITVGQPLRLTLIGYPDLSFDLEVISVGGEVIGLQEARQSLGGSIADTVVIDGSVILVEGKLPEALFDDGRQELAFRDGMQGVMEIKVRSRPIILHLIPGLEKVFRRRHD